MVGCQLQQRDDGLSWQAVSILENFFDVEEGEVENLAPQVDAQQGTYAFGGQQNGAGFGQSDANFKFGP